MSHDITVKFLSHSHVDFFQFRFKVILKTQLSVLCFWGIAELSLPDGDVQTHTHKLLMYRANMILTEH